MKKLIFILFLFSVCQAQTTKVVFKKAIGSGTCVPSDADAAAFYSAIGVSDNTICHALDSAAVRLKRFGIYSKGIAWYPMVGGTSTTCKFNFFDPRDLDAAYRITFSGTWTFDASGALPDGSTAYGNTHLIPNSAGMAYNDNSLGLYSATSAAGSNAASQYYDMGEGDNMVAGYDLWTRREGNTVGYDAGQASNNRSTGSNSDGSGFYLGTPIISSGFGWVYKNGSQLYSTPSTLNSTGTISIYEIFVGGFNEGNTSTIYHSNKKSQGNWIGLALTDQQAQDLSTIMVQFQSDLGR